MSFSYDTIWPMRIDMSELECRQILREKELICYSDILSVLRAQGPLSEEKKTLLFNLKKILSISDDRSKAELRRVANNEKLATIAEFISGYDGYAEWAAMGAMKFPPTLRPTQRTVYCDQASQTSQFQSVKEKQLPEPSETANFELSEKHNAAILTNRLTNKDKQFKVEMVSKSCLTSEINKTQDLYKNNKLKESAASHDYNLHLLSEIATGESNQSEQMKEQQTTATPVNVTANIKPDAFSIRHQINDIEEASNTEVVINNNPIITGPNNKSITANNPNILLTSSNVNNPNLSTSNSVPLVLSNTLGSQRYVLPRNSGTQGINLITTNQQKSTQGPQHSISSFISHQNQQQQQQSQSHHQQPNTYLTLTNNQLRSPTLSWNNQQQPQIQQQQVFISNVSTHTGMENLTALGYTLQQRAVRAEQTSNKSNLIVRNLGSQPNMEPERNKRFMLLKGGNSMGPSSKKSKISNPSNRQPGRPPLMPAPSSAYANRPYVANEIFNTNRSSSHSMSSGADLSLNDNTNGVRISSVSSRASGPSASASSSLGSNLQQTICGLNSNNSSTGNSISSNSGSAVNIAQIHKPNTGSGGGSSSYYNINNRGNGLQSRLQHSQATTSLNSITTNNNASGHNPSRSLMSSSNSELTTATSKQKNIQPVISVVPLSPVTVTGPIISSTIAQSNLQSQSTNNTSILMTTNLTNNSYSGSESTTTITPNYRRLSSVTSGTNIITPSSVTPTAVASTINLSASLASSASTTNINASNIINVLDDSSVRHGNYHNITSIGSANKILLNKESNVNPNLTTISATAKSINKDEIYASRLDKPTATVTLGEGDSGKNQ